MNNASMQMFHLDIQSAFIQSTRAFNQKNVLWYSVVCVFYHIDSVKDKYNFMGFLWF